MSQLRVSNSVLVVQACILLLILLRAAVRFATCCSKSLAFNGSVHTFVNCVDLPAQGASIAWTLVHPPSSSPIQDYYVLELAFSSDAPSADGWVGWGLNPERPQMVGSSTFLAYNAPNGSTLLPYRLTQATLGGAPLQCSAIDYTVQPESQVHISGVAMSMLLTLHLNASLPTSLYHVWNRGPSVSSFHPAPHAMQASDLKAFTQLDMSTGVAASTTSTHVGASSSILKTEGLLANPLFLISPKRMRTKCANGGDAEWARLYMGGLNILS